MSKTLLATTSAEGAKETCLKNCNALKNQSKRRILPVVPAAALAVAFASRCRNSPAPSGFMLETCPRISRCLRGTMHSSRVTASAPRTTSAHPQHLQPLVLPMPSSRRRPHSSATITSNSSLISSAPARFQTNTNPAVIAAGAIRPSRGNTATRAPYGAGCAQPIRRFQATLVIPLPTPLSSLPVPLPGSRLRRLQHKRDPTVATG